MDTEKQKFCLVHKGLKYSVKVRTGKMRFSPADVWKRIRFLLAEKQIDPTVCVLAQFYEDGPSTLSGVIVLSDRNVIEFSFRVREDDIAAGAFSLWRVLFPESREYRSWKEEIEFGLSLIE